MTFSNEIASCEEAAYNSLPIKDACTLLFFTNRSDLMTFAQQVKSFTLTFDKCTDVFANAVIERLGNRSYGRANPVSTERRGEDRDTQAEVDCGILNLRKGTRADCIDGIFINAIIRE